MLKQNTCLKQNRTHVRVEHMFDNKTHVKAKHRFDTKLNTC